MLWKYKGIKINENLKVQKVFCQNFQIYILIGTHNPGL